MSALFACPHGHRWRASLDDADASEAACPLCGAAAQRAEAPHSALDSGTLQAHRASPPVTSLPAIAGYEVLELIGRGGMGAVYRARHLRLGRMLAVKVLLERANASPQQLARFHLEAEALASLQHPNVVQIHEVGEHDLCPYLALELVEGGTLAARIKDAPQPPRESAQLIRTLAEAMHAVHARGVVHRDLKPTNVLLSSDNVLKITDFGLAKKLEGSGQTQTGAVLGTPSYMAPEQAQSKKDVGPLADVYALGAILYECLVGQPPFQAEAPMDTLLQVVSQEPTPPRTLNPRVPADLETICLKCLRKEPNQRYASAQLLADDLRRWLGDEPITARSSSTLERAVKWAKRRPAAAALALFLALSTLTGIVAGWAVALRERRHADELTLQRDAAEANWKLARDVVKKFVQGFGDQRLRGVPRLEQMRRDLLLEALEYNKRFLRQKTTDPAVRRETAEAYRLAGEIHQMLGSHADAENHVRQAIQLFADFPDQPEDRQALADCYHKLSQVVRELDRPDDFRAACEQGATLAEALVKNSPDVPAYRATLVNCWNALAVACKDAGQFDRAERLYRQVLAVEQAHALDHAKDYLFRGAVAASHVNLAYVLLQNRRVVEAEQLSRRALILFEALARDFPTDPDHRQNLAQVAFELGDLLNQTGRRTEALTHYDRATAVRAQLADEFPRIPRYRLDLAWSHLRRGMLLREGNRALAAAAAFGEVAALMNQVGTDLTPLPERGRAQAAALWEQSQVYASSGQPAKAYDVLTRLVPVNEQLAANHSRQPSFRYRLANTHNDMGVLLRQLKRQPEEEKVYRTALPTYKELVKEYPKVADYRRDLARALHNLGQVLVRTDRRDEAVKLYLQSLAHHRTLSAARPHVQEHYQDQVNTLYDLSQARRNVGLPPEAEEALRGLVAVGETLSAGAGKNVEAQMRVTDLLDRLGLLLKRAGKLDDAEAVHRRGIALLERLVTDSPHRPCLRSRLGTSLNNLAIVRWPMKDLALSSRLLQRAVQHQRVARQLNPGEPHYRNLLRNHYANLTLCWLTFEKHQEAALAAAELPRTIPTGWEEYHRAAGFLVRCVSLAQKDARLSAQQRQELVEGYSKQAVALLRQAVAQGYRDVRKLEDQAEFAPLRQREDFRQLVTQVTEKKEN